MALTAQPAASPTWGRWQQQSPNPHYVMVGAPMMQQYTGRTTQSPGIQRQPMGFPFLMSPPAYSGAAVSNMPPSHYHPQMPMHYNPYASPPDSVQAPFKDERPILRGLATEADVHRAADYQRDPRACYPEEGGGNVKIENHQVVSPQPAVPQQLDTPVSPAAVLPKTRTITSNIPVGGVCQPEFHTAVDTLMRSIQTQAPTNNTLKRKARADKDGHGDAQIEMQAPQMKKKKKVNRKEHKCNVSGCGKTFLQKTHLDIHLRAHTGEKPYVCALPGCGHRFTQLGNLKTHERRHTGEKPYHCEKCGKRFAQRGNVRAHMRTHEHVKPYVCKLDGCNKRLSQLGNLKAHMNRFHAGSIKALTDKFAGMRPEDIPDDDRELWEYFAALYKNSNKGIKGRGRDRKVGPTMPVTPVSPDPSLPAQYRPHATIHGHHVMDHHAVYATNRIAHHNLMMPMALTRDHHGGYGLYDPDQESITVSGASSTTGGGLYEDDHTRDMGFGERMY